MKAFPVRKTLRWLSGVGACLSLVACVYPLLYAEWLRTVMNDVQNGDTALWVRLLYAVPLVLCQLLLIWGQSAFWAYLYNRYAVDLRAAFLRKLTRAKLPALSAFDIGGIMTRFRQDIDVLSGYYAGDCQQLVAVIFSFCLACVYVGSFSLIYLPFCVLPALLSVFLLKKARAKQEAVFQASAEVAEQLDTFYTDMTEGYEDLRQFGAEETFLRKGRRITEENAKHVYTSGKLQNYTMYISMLSHSLTTILILALGVLLVYGGYGQFGDCVAIYSVFYMIANPIRNFSRHLSVWKKKKVSAQRLRELLTLPEEKAAETETDMPADIFPLRVRLDSFSYGGEYVLPPVRFIVGPRSYTVIVGASGSGKSTTARLLVGFADEYSGEIELGGREARTLCPAFVRSHVLYVASEHWLPEGTVAGLFGLGSRMDQAALDRILDVVELRDYIAAQPDGVQTWVEENARNLSGGERQRLLLGLALSQKASVYVLDEMTSSVEAEQGLRILKAARAYRPEAAFVQITHDMQFPPIAEQVVYFDGTAALTGSHASLMRECDPYAAFAGGETSC